MSERLGPSIETPMGVETAIGRPFNVYPTKVRGGISIPEISVDIKGEKVKGKFSLRHDYIYDLNELSQIRTPFGHAKLSMRGSSSVRSWNKQYYLKPRDPCFEIDNILEFQFGPFSDWGMIKNLILEMKWKEDEYAPIFSSPNSVTGGGAIIFERWSLMEFKDFVSHQPYIPEGNYGLVLVGDPMKFSQATFRLRRG